jgi:predicted acyltransferase
MHNPAATQQSELPSRANIGTQATSANASRRIHSIDIFRGLTMLLMIFVNDFWTLEGVPRWLLHAKAGEDFLGFSDIIFPGFLFIVGLSIPFAIQARQDKGESPWQMLQHILYRSLALLVMGVFIVNLENIHGDAIPVFGRSGWAILMALAFFLIWNRYPHHPEQQRFFRGLQLAGTALLLVLYTIYAGGSADNPLPFQPHWWGILGLIGWTYLVCSSIYVLSSGKLWATAGAWLFFCAFNLAAFAGRLDALDILHQLYLWPVGDGAMMAFTMAGVLSSVIYLRLKQHKAHQQFIAVLLGMAVLTFLLGYFTRPYWGVSKLAASPAWLAYCTAISLAVYALLYWLVDVKGRKSWAGFLKPAGTSTLTCYLIPYFWYPIVAILGLSLPAMLTMGTAGLLKSLAFALLIVGITAVVNKWGIRLKI